MEESIFKKLLATAKEAAKHSYSPYSHFSVGAAVMTEEGSIYSGTNIENASYGDTVCAERVAIFKAVSEGARKLLALAVYSKKAALAYPCGMCLQVINEFADGEMPVLVAGNVGEKQYKLSDLLPHPFDAQ